MTCCKVNTTAYNPNKAVKMGEVWPYHPQQLNTPELYKAMCKKLFEIERDTDPGVEFMDSFMVVYEDSYGLFHEWEQYHDQPIKTGKFRVIFEKQNGGNYQMFNTAYQTLKPNYEWFMFTCDDIVIFGDGYYKKILDKWQPGCGYVALQGINMQGDRQHHVQGSIGLTNRSVLENVAATNLGQLPHAKGEWTQEANIHEGEIPFTHKMLELGYFFVKYNDSEAWKKENLCFPYFWLRDS